MPRPPRPGTTYSRPGTTGYRDMGGTTPVQFDPDTGVIIGDTPPGYYPPGFVPGPTPGTMQTPGTPGGRFGSQGRGGTNPPQPPGRSIPIPGLSPGHSAPPPGSFPWPGGGYGTPGTPGEMGDARGEGARPGTPATGPYPMPFDPSQLPDYGPPLPATFPGNFWPDFTDRFGPRPNIPSRQSIEDYHDQYKTGGPFISPDQMYDYETPTADDIPGGVRLGDFFDQTRARQLLKPIGEQRIQDSIYRNEVDPFIDNAVMSGIGGLIEGMQPNTDFPVPNTIFGVPAGMKPGPPPILDPLNYPGIFGGGGGGGGFQFPTLDDIGGFIGDQFTPMPTPGAQFPPAPPMPGNIPPMGGGPMGGGPMGQFPGQFPGQMPGQMPGGFQPTLQQRPMYP